MSRKHAATTRIKVWSPLLAATKTAAGTVTPYSKALVGALFGAAAIWLKVRADGVDQDELWQILGAAASGAGLVYAVPNKDPRGRKQDESVQPPDKPGDAGRRAVASARTNRKGAAHR